MKRMTMLTKTSLLTFIVLITVGISAVFLLQLAKSDITNIEIGDGKALSVRKLVGADVQTVCFYPSYSWARPIDCTGDRWVLDPDVPTNMLFFTVISNGRCSNYSISAVMGVGLNSSKFCMTGDQANHLSIARKGAVVFADSPN
ncbi:hypothetical protein ACFQ14_16400 [Pseudahrensia aquimaris]|uniref:Uncharacterized protein n=1 Tax=Pseudahrensia aquimaris TaxID=744461 RepID=A0ABW3FHL2_9HYPH